MEEENLEQYESGNERSSNDVRDARVQLSRDNKWVIIRLEVEGKPVSVIKPVNYFEKILQRARSRTYDTGKIKG